MRQQILVIDDFKWIHPQVRALLGSEPVDVHSAVDGRSGLVLAASLRPDLILLDVDMPGMDGFETCRELKENPLTADIPVVFLTARAAPEELARGLNLGANDYVKKPFKLSELLSRVRAALRISGTVRRLEGRAMIDALTGLGNRAMLETRFSAEVGLRVRSGNPLSCIVMDVDYFKDVNDRYGHPFGDHVLCKIANVIGEICRIEDVACRYGGEEFAILAPHTGADQAAQLAERMRGSIATIPFARGDEFFNVTCSFGVAEALGTYDRLMLNRADHALYESKKHGRNRVSVAPPQFALAGGAVAA